MTILADFSERMRGESRLGFIKRKLEQAHQKSLDLNEGVTLRGYFYDSDLDNVYRFTGGLTPDECKPRARGGCIATFTITPNTCIF